MDKLCSESECNKPAKIGGLCGAHYGRVHRSRHKDDFEWRERKRKLDRESKQRRRALDPDGTRLYNRTYVENNRDRAKLYIHNRRAKQKANGPSDFKRAEWLAIVELQEGKCFYCGVLDLRLEIEHKVPISRGGQHTKSNIVAACRSCNRRKGTRTADEFLST